MQVPVILLHGPFRADHYKVVDALVEGALDFVERPPACDTVQTFLSELVVRIKLATELSDVRRRHAERSSEQRVHRLQGVSSAARSRLGTSLESTRAVVIIGSHGGCWSLANLIPELPPRLGIGTVVVEQLPEGFTAALADRLDRHSALEVREAGGGEQLNPGSVYLAPGGRHLRLAGDGKLLISDDPPVDNLRPRADLVVGDAVRLYGERVLLVLLSGTGKDGLDGAREVREHGGRVIVEAESSAIAFGTQLAAIEAKLADEVVPLEGMAHAIAEAAGIWGQSERRAGNYISTLTGFDQPA
jgi:two-component system chemotaxis response regulator CheB